MQAVKELSGQRPPSVGTLGVSRDEGTASFSEPYFSGADSESDQLPLETDDPPTSPIPQILNQNDQECPIGKASFSRH